MGAEKIVRPRDTGYIAYLLYATCTVYAFVGIDGKSAHVAGVEGEAPTFCTAVSREAPHQMA